MLDEKKLFQRLTVLKTDTCGQVEYTKAYGKIKSKELGKIAL